MFSKFALFVVSAVALGVAAAPANYYPPTTSCPPPVTTPPPPPPPTTAPPPPPPTTTAPPPPPPTTTAPPPPPPTTTAPPPPPPPANNVSQCNVGKMHCCNSVQNANSASVQSLGGLLGIAAGALTGQVGLDCLSVVGGNSCTAQPVCCTGNNFNGLIVVGCSPINVNL